MSDVVVAGTAGASLVLPVPAGWWVGDSPGVAAVLVRESVPASGVRTNVMLGHTRVHAAIGLDDIATRASDRLATANGAPEVRGAREVVSDTGRGLLRMVLFDAGPQAVRLAQLQGFFDAGGAPAAHDEPRRDVWTVAATAAADDLAELGDELAQIVSAARVVCATRATPRSPAVE